MFSAQVLRLPSRLTVEQLSRNVAKSYTILEELKDAAGFIAHVYESHHPFGFVLSGKADELTIAKTVDRFIAGVGKPAPDILLKIVKGDWSIE